MPQLTAKQEEELLNQLKDLDMEDFLLQIKEVLFQPVPPQNILTLLRTFYITGNLRGILKTAGLYGNV